MNKKHLFSAGLLLTSLILIFTLPFLFAFSPYHFYSVAIERGIDNQFVNYNKLSKNLLKGSDYKIYQMSGAYGKEQNVWKNVHFYNFIIPLPIRHPLLTLHSNLTEKSIGAKFIDNNDVEFLNLSIPKAINFDLIFRNQKLFNLPVFKEYILSKNINTIYKDLFLKDITPLESIDGLTIKHLKRLWDTSYNELVYNLFIGQMRQRLFPKDTKKVEFYHEKNYGVVTIYTKEKLKKESIFFLDNGVLHTINVQTSTEEIMGEALRVRFHKVLELKISQGKTTAVSSYAFYKTLNFKDRISSKGFTYLFSAWSHVQDNSSFFREMIQFLERGKNNIKVLTPLYEYAYQNFGTTFSLIEKYRKEKEEEKLKRKIKEEEDKEFFDQLNSKHNKIEGRFDSGQEKVNYYLQKAKDSKQNIDKKDSSLDL